MDYYRLTKPGIVYGNAIPALAAFLFAAQGHPSLVRLLGMLFGLMGIIAASCVVNNVLDRDIDTHMERTKDRALPAGRISIQSALLFAAILAILGSALLLLFTNLLTFLVALFGVVVYLGFYTPLKRITQHSTIVGALAGAVPPVVGYVAVTNNIDTTALVLFLILVCWQMVHFFAISIFRVDEYAAAQLPVMSVYSGMWRTKALMSIYAVLFTGAIFALYIVSGLSLLFVGILGGLSLVWILFSLYGFRTHSEKQWARSMFLYSIVLLLVFCVVLAFS